MVMKPAWLEGLIGESFFGICRFHENKRKNEKNIFCLDCCQSFCPHCLPTHHSHPLLQVYIFSILPCKFHFYITITILTWNSIRKKVI
ncbi:putative transcription factor interactor and regulator Znf-B family [Helianthus annuus]|nr:putative transcription factor interactor and regulator Znf-B family [Helianthus annuus]KAJ0659702.1 putative transcription factor interactor and regulator Znf-B family [Helianthus annuus]